MREIKFRAWNTDFRTPTMEYFTLQEASKQWNLLDKQIMQYTGLKDKNGRDIYEGDNLKNTVGNWEGYVCFSDGSYWLQARLQSFVLNKNRVGKCEVIGNIYENPEPTESTTNKGSKPQEERA